MDRLFKSAILRGVFGFMLGTLAGGGILCLSKPDMLVNGADLSALFPLILSSGLYGAVGMGSTVVYDVEHWSVTRATLTHLLVTLGGLYILGLTQGWLTLSLFGFLVPTLGFSLVYFIIWLAMCLSLRRKVSQMNRDVKAWKSARRLRPPSDCA